jgi:chaperonin GroES
LVHQVGRTLVHQVLSLNLSTTYVRGTPGTPVHLSTPPSMPRSAVLCRSVPPVFLYLYIANSLSLEPSTLEHTFSPLYDLDLFFPLSHFATATKYTLIYFNLASIRQNIMALRKLLPLGNRVLVSRIVATTQTASGIYLPEAAQKRPNEGTVVSVGPGLKDEDGKFIPVSVSEGDSVLLPEYGGTEVKLGDDTFHLFRDDDILGKFE